jgi:hypothetical protein
LKTDECLNASHLLVEPTGQVRIQRFDVVVAHWAGVAAWSLHFCQAHAKHMPNKSSNMQHLLILISTKDKP